MVHLAGLNLGALVVEAGSKGCGSLSGEFHYLLELLASLEGLLRERPQLHMGFLITRQIQQEEEAVRTERLADYEEKIYDQRRIIADKEGFFEALLRPRRKRPPQQTAEEFQESRARERDQEDRSKSELLGRELAELAALRRAIDATRLKKSRSGTESTRSETEGEFGTERTLGDRSNKENHLSHCRTNSLQASFFRDQPKEEDAEEGNLPHLLQELRLHQQDSRLLQALYEQLAHTLRFKRGQVGKAQRQYLGAEQERREAQMRLEGLKEGRGRELSQCY